MPYTLRINSEDVPPKATLVDSAGIAVATTEITSGTAEAELRSWAESAAAAHEAAVAQQAAEVTEAQQATTKAEALKVALDGTEIEL